jgi:hypothetical protein
MNKAEQELRYHMINMRLLHDWSPGECLIVGE